MSSPSTCVSAALLLCLGLPFSAPAQRHAAKPSAVSGHIFAITGGGDIKPARMAKVYLIYHYLSVKSATANPEEEQNAPGMTWLLQKEKAVLEYLKERGGEGISWSDSIACRRELLSYDKAVIGTFKWAEDQNKTDQLLFTDADEEGIFRIVVTRPGVYTLLARGRAGLNDAFWETGHVVVKSGMETTVKLSSPEKSCLTIE